MSVRVSSECSCENAEATHNAPIIHATSSLFRNTVQSAMRHEMAVQKRSTVSLGVFRRNHIRHAPIGEKLAVARDNKALRMFSCIYRIQRADKQRYELRIYLPSTTMSSVSIRVRSRSSPSFPGGA